MPTINKIRIVNYAYNDDKRLIIDETFDYHGKNGMMHLLNGGGKTVLIQAIMQPFIPLSKLGKREFDELFRKDKEPSYVLIEWRLDNNNGYMTSGIAIKRTSNAQDDENSEKFDYFTFILESAKSNTNISNLKLSTRIDDKISFINYHNLKALISKSNGSTYERNSEAYKRALNSFRIDIKEWKNVIAKINSEEGGLLKLFEKCNTSNDLMRDWILKSIKENLSDSTNISDLLEQTEKHIINARQKIEDKEKRRDLSLYTYDLNEVKTEVGKLKNISDKTVMAKTVLSNLEYSLNNYIIDKSQEVNDLQEEKEILNKRLDEIKIEELSLQYYQQEDLKNELIEELTDKERESDKLNNELAKYNRLMDSYRVADLTKQCLDKEKELENITTKLQKLSKEQSEIDKEIENVGFTVKTLYENKIKDMENVISENKNILLESNEKLDILSKKFKKVSNEYIDLEKKVSSINANIISSDKRIKDLSTEINPLNIFISSDKSEVIKEQISIKARIEEINNEISTLKNEEEKIKVNIKNNVDLIENLLHEKNNINNKINKADNDLSQFYKELSDITTKLSDHGVENFSLSNKESTIELMANKISILGSSINNNNADVIKNEDILNKLSSGGIKINSDFIKYLNNKGIIYVLGSDYIKNSFPTEELRKEVINTNPLLPFAIILDKKSISDIQKDMPEMYSDSPIIVIEREMLNNINISSINGYSEIIKSIGILSLYNKELVIKIDIEHEKNKIKAEIKRLQEESDNWDNQKNNLILLKNQIENFNYDEYFENDLNKQIINLKDELSNKEKLLEDIKNENVELEKQQTLKNLVIKDKEKSINDLNIQVKRCEELANLISEKEKLDEELKVFSNQSKEVNKEKELLEETVNSLQHKILDIKVRSSSLKEKASYEKGKQKIYLRYITGEFIKEDLELLEQRYKTLKGNSDENLIDEYIQKESNLKTEIKDYEKKISAYTDFDIIEYDFELEFETTKKIPVLTGKIKDCSSKIAVINNNIKRIESLMKSIIEKLKPNELVDKEKIGKYLNKEKEVLYKNIEIKNNSIIEIASDLQECQKVINRIKDSGLLMGFSIKTNNYYEDYINQRVGIFEKNNREILKLKNEEESIKGNIKNKVESLSLNHSKKNATIDNSISSLKQMVLSNTPAELHSNIERQISIIDMLLIKIKTDLEVLESEEKYIIERYLDVARQYTEEINKIDKNSYINIKGKKLKMMKIKNIKYDETSPVKLSSYIKRQLENIINNMSLLENDLVKAVNREFNIENLLISYCALDNVRIYFLKIEDNIQLSSDRPWEEVTTNNSGGEKFVSYFVIFSTLINYERGNHLNKEAVSMCLIMDNPFAAISSKHLLIPLFEYAKKTNIQLICFTDHNKADIIDRFDVIHKLVIKTLVNHKEFVSSEKVKESFEILDDGHYFYNEQTSFI
jgi:chromosome segregation ATPase